ncbi:MAG: glycoside hydrolase family 5 protein [Dysgonamonadaceae bacterium]|jgi:endoglucanase|nr:glycoside hydrolase family 5 protein [Dysgonamonadaceae bacterium]
MKKILKITSILTIFIVTIPFSLFATGNLNNMSIPADKTGMNSDAVVLSGKIGLGWNLGNTLEASNANSASETMWGNPQASKILIDSVKAAGFNAVRIPCAWNGYIEDPVTYKIKDSWLARVKEVVDYCVENDMYAILNIHWDGGWLENNPIYSKQEAVNKKQKALWKQIAVYFRDYDEHLLFAGTNEVHVDYREPSNENIAVQSSYNQTFIDAVRSTGGRNMWRNLIVQAYNTNIDWAVKYLTLPVDPTSNRMMVEVHYYDPYEFCLKEDNSVFLWGKDFTGSGMVSWGQEDWVNTQFKKMKTHFTDKGIPVILGEYGTILRTNLAPADYISHLKARNYYLNYVTKIALQNGMVPVYWDNGSTGNNAFGLFNRHTGKQVHADAIQAIINASK